MTAPAGGWACAAREVSLVDARRCDAAAEVGGQLTLKLPQDRDEAPAEHVLALLRLPAGWEAFGRRAAKRAKDIILAAARGG